jgi:hypothetical protein
MSIRPNGSSRNGDTIMLTTIALSLVIVLAAASGAFAETKHHGHKGPAIHVLVSASALSDNASVAGKAGRIATG